MEQNVLSVRGITHMEGRPLGYLLANISEGEIIYMDTVLKNHNYTLREEGVIRIKDRVSNVNLGAISRMDAEIPCALFFW